MNKALLPAAAVLVAVAISACGKSASSLAPRTNPAPHGSVYGTVIGGIEPCTAVRELAVPPLSAGMVIALKGRAQTHNTAIGSAYRLPRTIVARLTMAQGQQYRFRLRPGAYVLDARSSPGENIRPWVQVRVWPGQTLHADIPNFCL